MGYDANNSEEQKGVEPDIMEVGVIVNIKDGIVKDFVQNTEKWSGDLNGPAINVTFEVMYEGVAYRSDKIFTYKIEGEKTVYPIKSNLGKYIRKYGKAPEVGDKVKMLSNQDGYFRLVFGE